MATTSKVTCNTLYKQLHGVYEIIKSLFVQSINCAQYVYKIAHLCFLIINEVCLYEIAKKSLIMHTFLSKYRDLTTTAVTWAYKYSNVNTASYSVRADLLKVHTCHTCLFKPVFYSRTFITPSLRSFVRSLTHSIIHSLTHSLTHSHGRAHAHTYTHAYARIHTHPQTHALVRLSYALDQSHTHSHTHTQPRSKFKALSV